MVTHHIWRRFGGAFFYDNEQSALSFQGSMIMILSFFCRRCKHYQLLPLFFTKDIPLQDLKDLLPEYDLHQLFVDCEDVGHSAVRRERTYIYACHRETGSYNHDVHELYKEITDKIKAAVTTRCRDYFVASPCHRAVHAQEVCRKRKIAWRPVPRWHLNSLTGLLTAPVNRIVVLVQLHLCHCQYKMILVFLSSFCT